MAKVSSPSLFLISFSPADAERITGVTGETQRAWRRRGFLPKSGVHGAAQFNVFGLAEMTVMKQLSDRLGGPAVTKNVVGVVARAIVVEALQHWGAYDCERLDRLNQFDPEFLERPELSAVKKGSDDWRNLLERYQIDWMANEVAWSFDLDMSRLGDPIYVVIRGGKAALDHDFIFALEAVDGPVWSLNPAILAEQLLARIGRGVVRVDFVPTLSKSGRLK